MRALILKVALAGMSIVCSTAGLGQEPADGSCATAGKVVLARHWDPLMGRGWELIGDCSHPEWPARLVAASGPGSPVRFGKSHDSVAPKGPLLVHAGEVVLVWMLAERVLIEMSGVAERSARGGESVVVRVTQQTGDEGVTVERFSGTVRGIGDVEMEATR